MRSDGDHSGHTSRSQERCGAEGQRGDSAGTHLVGGLGVWREMTVTGARGGPDRPAAAVEDRRDILEVGLGAPCGEREPSGDVQKPVAQPPGLGLGELPGREGPTHHRGSAGSRRGPARSARSRPRSACWHRGSSPTARASRSGISGDRDLQGFDVLSRDLRQHRGVRETAGSHRRAAFGCGTWRSFCAVETNAAAARSYCRLRANAPFRKSLCGGAGACALAASSLQPARHPASPDRAALESSG
jgi:hypothetical protein